MDETNCGGWIYLLLNVIKRIWRVDGKADQNDMGVWVGERPKTIIIFLASSIPQCKLDMFSIHLNIGDVVFEDSRDVNLCKRATSVYMRMLKKSVVSMGFFGGGGKVDGTRLTQRSRVQGEWTAVKDSPRGRCP